MALDMPTSVQLRRFTTAEYHQMREAGILGEDDRVELIDGEVVQMSPIGSRHAACVDRLVARFFAELAGRVQVRVQSPILLNDLSEPEPDVTLLHLKANAYADAHPRPADVLLVVEVADVTLAYDQTVKVPRYASAGVPEVWVIDLGNERVAVYRDPRVDGYRNRRHLVSGEAMSCHAFPDVRIAVADVLLQEAADG